MTSRLKYGEATRLCSFRLPPTLLEALTQAAAERKISQAELLVKLCERAGIWKRP